MGGATVVTVLGGAIAGATVPFTVGLMSSSVVYGRWYARA
jgi:hypothetical protein